jgi:hypothetical protein
MTPTSRPLTLACLTLALAAVPLHRAHAEGEGGGFSPTAEAGSGFGAQGQLALSLGGTAGEYLFFHKNGGAWQLGVAPAADYFLAPRLSVGGVVAYTHASGGGGTNGDGTTTFRIAARAGYVFDFTDRLGVWPLGGVAVDVLSANHDTSTNTFVVLYVPFIYHLAPHFFVGLGPSADIRLTGNDDSAWGLNTLLGGWF